MGQRICFVDDCDNLARARGWCDKHYKRWRRHGDPVDLPPRKLPPQCQPRTIGCSVDGCDDKHSGRGFCKKHHARFLYHQDRDAHLAAMAAYRALPGNRERANARSKAWREANPERLKAGQRAWREANRDREREMKRAYREANRDAIRALNNRRKARQRNVAINDLTPQQWVAIVAAYDGRCAYCAATPERITMDHVIPISKGGNHTASNVVPACGPCNFGKGNGPAPPFVIEPAA